MTELCPTDQLIGAYPYIINSEKNLYDKKIIRCKDLIGETYSAMHNIAHALKMGEVNPMTTF